MVTLLTLACIATLWPAAIIVNCLVCVLVIKYQAMRTFTNGLVVSLALSDIMTGIVILTQYLIGFNNRTVINIAYAIVMLSGVANLCAVTYDRYVAVTQPFRYLSIMQKNYRYLLISVWLISAMVAVLPILWKDRRHTQGHQFYVMAVQILFIGLPFIVIAIIYYRIYYHARKCNKVVRRHSITHVINTKSFQRTESEFKVACVFAFVTAMFFLSWFPVIYYTSAFLFGHARSVPREITELSPITLALGSLGNPFIYSLVKPDFRKALRKLLGIQRKHFGKGSGNYTTSVSRWSQKKGRESQDRIQEKNPKETNLWSRGIHTSFHVLLWRLLSPKYLVIAKRIWDRPIYQVTFQICLVCLNILCLTMTSLVRESGVIGEGERMGGIV